MPKETKADYRLLIEGKLLEFLGANERVSGTRNAVMGKVNNIVIRRFTRKEKWE